MARKDIMIARAFRLGVLEMVLVVLGLLFVRREIWQLHAISLQIDFWQESLLIPLAAIDGAITGAFSSRSRNVEHTPAYRRSMTWGIPAFFFLYVACAALCERLHVGIFTIGQMGFRTLGFLIVVGGIGLRLWAQTSMPAALQAPVSDEDASKGNALNQDSAALTAKSSAGPTDGSPTPQADSSPLGPESSPASANEGSTPDTQGSETSAPEGSQTSATESFQTSAPEGSQTSEPEGSPTSEPEGSPTSAPEGSQTSAPEGSQTSPPEGSQTSAPEGSQTSTPEGSTPTSTPESSPTAAPASAQTPAAASSAISPAGPHKWVRYPDVLGELVSLIGLSLAFDTWLPLLILPGVLVLVKWHISDREAFRISQLGQPYLDYRKRTRNLVPFIY